MKKSVSIVLKGFGDAVPIACGMIACTCAMMTAYEIGFSRTPLILFCIFSALLLSFWMNVPKYGFGFGALFLSFVIMLCAFRMKRIGDGAVSLIYRLLYELPKGISGLVDMDALTIAAEKVANPESCISLFLMLVAAFFGFMLAFSLIRSKMVLLPLLIPLPMLLVSLVYTNRPPALWTMALLAVYMGYALLGNGLRKGDFKRHGLFTAILAPLLLILVLLIAAMFPQKDYTPLSAERRKAFFSERFGPIVDEAMSWFGVRNPKNVDLKDEDEREEDDTKLFTVYARKGVHLLRTHSYGVYRNNHWMNADEYKGEWHSMQALGLRQEKTDATMWIYESLSGERIAPYAWTDEPVTSDADEQPARPVAEESFIRSYGWRDYSWRYVSRYRTEPGEVTEEERDYYENFALKQYVMPDGEEKSALLDILNAAGIKDTGDAQETAKTVAAFVRGSGTYSLKPGTVPRGKDFVLYFLTENRKGYCVHFASATTALLQALGYPARYTIGYYVDIPEEMSRQGFDVTRNDEHAWAEVYILGLGWVPIESTPGRYDAQDENSEQTQTGQQPTATPKPSKTPEPTPAPTPKAPTEAPSDPTAEPTPENTTEPHETEQPTPAPQGQNENGEPPQGGGETGKKRGSAWWILIPVLPAAWVGTGLLFRRRRELRFRDPNVRRSIPEMAYYLDRLTRFGVKKDPEVDEWALEAAFSNHKMQEEHRALLRIVHAAQKAVCTDKPALRFLLRWVLYLI
ncbi:MAG: hypothetical protein IKZ44_10165 [Clostridia bacterium]|nr:hypothetical protein [Clostridia bacterium]